MKVIFAIAAAQHCADDTDESNSDFFAWDVAASPPPLLTTLFPNSTQLQSAWEVTPLLSKVAFDKHQQDDLKNNTIPVILHNRSSILPLQSGRDPFLSLLTVDDTLSIISQPSMKHGVDYKLVKKIVQNGEEHLGMLPKPHYSINEVISHFNYGGFSMVIDRMHRRWEPIALLSTSLEEELNSIKVGVNMYLTPEVALESDGHKKQGFEAHWDWMDVIVIQIKGRKRWSVANEPTVYLSNRDQKRKPTIEEIQHYVQSPARSSEFTLCPGDALYIPRGHIHNASTVLNDSEALGTSGPLDDCPSSYPTEEMATLLNWNGPSLHLTFGIEQSCEGTLEALLHHALHLYFDDNRAFDTVAISAKSCYSGSQAASTHDIKWEAVLHHALAAVARERHVCDFPSFHGTSAKLKDCKGSASLRRSLPLGLSEQSDSMQYSHLKEAFLDALDIFKSSASISATAAFVQTLQTPPTDPELIFCFPGYSAEHVVTCPDSLMSLNAREFKQVLTDFYDEASTNFHSALRYFDEFGNAFREKNRKQRLADLEMVAQAKK